MSALKIRVGPRPLGLWPLGALLALPLALLPLGGWLVDSGTMVLARCTFKSMLGIPCMGCGCTRATLNLLHGDLVEALTFSPMIVIIYFGLLLWGLVSMALYISGRRAEVEMSGWLTWMMRGALVSLPFLNWFYLMAYDL